MSRRNFPRCFLFLGSRANVRPYSQRQTSTRCKDRLVRERPDRSYVTIFQNWILAFDLRPERNGSASRSQFSLEQRSLRCFRRLGKRYVLNERIAIQAQARKNASSWSITNIFEKWRVEQNADKEMWNALKYAIVVSPNALFETIAFLPAGYVGLLKTQECDSFEPDFLGTTRGFSR